MKRKMKKKLIAFMLCMVLVICNSVSILADAPAEATTTAEKQVSETKTAKNEKSSEENKSKDDNDASKQSEETDETKDKAPEATTTEKKEETTETSTEKKDETSGTTTKAKDETEKAEEGTTEATTKKKDDTEAADETSESSEKKETTTTENSSETSGTTEETTEAADETTAANVKKYEYKSDDVNVSVTLTNPEDLPDDAELVVTPVTLSQKVENKISKQSIEKKVAIDEIFAYDIKFMQNGQEIQPGSTVKVNVSKPEIKASQTASVYHVDDSNNLEDMDGQIDNNGDVVFDTTHFSTYVIVSEKDDLTVKIEHYNITKDSQGNDVYGSQVPYYGYQKIYQDDEETLDSGDRIENYAKATNWEVEKVEVVTGSGHSSETDTLNNENEWDEITVAEDATIKVYYRPIETSREEQTTFYDYVVKAGKTWINGEQVNASINAPSNYADPNANKKLEIGLADDEHWESHNYREYRYDDWTLPATRITTRQNGTISESPAGDWNPNSWSKTMDDTVVRGLVNELDSNGNVVFNYEEPGFFVDSDKIMGDKTVRKVYKDYKLVFNQEGDTYTLTNVKNPQGKTCIDSVNEFFPLDGVKDVYTDTAYNQNTGSHNYYFGMRYDVEFTIGDYVGPLEYTFSGDDDLWVILDGKEVVIDLGGIHKSLPGTVDLWEVLEDAGIKKGELTDEQKQDTHQLTILYMERGAELSNCEMEFTLPSAEFVGVKPVPKTSLQFNKKNSGGTALQGAKFTLTKDGSGRTSTATSDEYGHVTFTNLSAGTYTLTETQTPGQGYVLPQETWKVIVTTKGETTTAALYQSDGVTLVEDNTIINYTEIETVEKKVEVDKTASTTDEDYENRIYTIDLSASSNTMSAEIAGGKVSVILVLDESGSMEGSIGTLKTAARSFVSELRKNSPDSEVAVISFESSVDTRIGFTKLNSDHNINQLNSAIDQLSANGGTRIGQALERANTLLDEADNAKTFVVAFSDGAPGLYYDSDPGDASDEATKAYTAANNIKDKGATIYTVGYGENINKFFHWNSEHNPTNNATCEAHDSQWWVPGGWFEQGHYENNYCYKGIQCSTFLGLLGEYSYADSSNLEEIFENLAGQASRPLSVTAEYIEDTIDSRFELTEESRKDLLSLNVDGKQAVEIIDNDDGTTTIRWNGVLINPKDGDTPGWSASFDIKAKDDFMGGNMIPTNAPSSGVYIKLNEGDDEPTQLPFDEPSVNVKLLTPEIGNKEITIFKGDMIQPDGFLGEIAGTFHVKDFTETENLTSEDNIPVLSESELATLKSDGKFIEKYKYPGTEDVVGKFEFTYTKPQNGDHNHPAETSGNPVETYTLEVKYIPDSVDTRDEKILSNVTPPLDNGGTEVIEKSISGTYKVNVVAGAIDITKELSLPDTEDKAFTFKVEYLTKTSTVDEEKSFTVTGVVEDGEVSTDIADNRLTDLWRGTYRVTEEETTEGYSLISVLCGGGTTCYSTTSEGEIIFTIGSIKNSYGNKELVGGTDSTGKTIGLTEDQINRKDGQIGEVTFKNERLSTININKQDRNNTPLEHARFKLEVKNANNNEYEAVKDTNGGDYIVETDDKGAAKFENLKSGDYRITEIQSPEGFSLLANPIEVALPYDVDVNNDSVVCTEGKTPVEYEGKTYYHDITYTIINNQLFTMPEAGGRNIFLLTLAGTAMIALASGSTIYYRRRRGVHNRRGR